MSLSNMTGVRSVVSAGAVGVVGAASVANVALAVPGAEVGDGAMVNADVLPAGLALGQPVVTAGTVTVPVINPTAGGVDAGSPNFRVQLIKATGSV